MAESQKHVIEQKTANAKKKKIMFALMWRPKTAKTDR